MKSSTYLRSYHRDFTAHLEMIKRFKEALIAGKVQAAKNKRVDDQSVDQVNQKNIIIQSKRIKAVTNTMNVLSKVLDRLDEKQFEHGYPKEMGTLVMNLWSLWYWARSLSQAAKSKDTFADESVRKEWVDKIAVYSDHVMALGTVLNTLLMPAATMGRMVSTKSPKVSTQPPPYQDPAPKDRLLVQKNRFDLNYIQTLCSQHQKTLEAFQAALVQGKLRAEREAANNKGTAVSAVDEDFILANSKRVKKTLYVIEAMQKLHNGLSDNTHAIWLPQKKTLLNTAFYIAKTLQEELIDEAAESERTFPDREQREAWKLRLLQILGNVNVMIMLLQVLDKNNEKVWNNKLFPYWVYRFTIPLELPTFVSNPNQEEKTAVASTDPETIRLEEKEEQPLLVANPSQSKKKKDKKGGKAQDTSSSTNPFVTTPEVSVSNSNAKPNASSVATIRGIFDRQQTLVPTPPSSSRAPLKANGGTSSTPPKPVESKGNALVSTSVTSQVVSSVPAAPALSASTTSQKTEAQPPVTPKTWQKLKLLLAFLGTAKGGAALAFVLLVGTGIPVVNFVVAGVAGVLALTGLTYLVYRGVSALLEPKPPQGKAPVSSPAPQPLKEVRTTQSQVNDPSYSFTLGRNQRSGNQQQAAQTTSPNRVVLTSR